MMRAFPTVTVKYLHPTDTLGGRWAATYWHDGKPYRAQYGFEHGYSDIVAIVGAAHRAIQRWATTCHQDADWATDAIVGYSERGNHSTYTVIFTGHDPSPFV